MKLLVLSGSLRSRSTTDALLHTALEALPDEDSGQVRTPDISLLPHFSPDLDGEGTVPPPHVAALRADATRADALLVVSPEYVHGVPGSLKNALDWLVSGSELSGTATAVFTGSPAPTGGEYAYAQLRETLSVLTGEVVAEACMAVGLIRTKTDPAAGRVTDEATHRAVTEAMAALAARVA